MHPHQEEIRFYTLMKCLWIFAKVSTMIGLLIFESATERVVKCQRYFFLFLRRNKISYQRINQSFIQHDNFIRRALEYKKFVSIRDKVQVFSGQAKTTTRATHPKSLEGQRNLDSSTFF